MISVQRNVRPNYRLHYSRGKIRYTQSLSVGGSRYWRDIRSDLNSDGFELVKDNLLNKMRIDARVSWIRDLRNIVQDLISPPLAATEMA